MTKQDMVRILASYRRPDTPVFAYHFRRLPPELLRKGNVRGLLAILRDTSLPPKVRDHAAGALGEIGDKRAVKPLVEALGEARLRRGAAVALGRMKAKQAAAPLKELAPRVNAARWALSELGLARSTEDVVDDLRMGQLRAIGPKIRKLSPQRAKPVSVEVQRRLAKVVGERPLSHQDSWLVTALQFLAPPEASSLVTAALGRAVRLRNCCGCVRNRLLRTVGEIRPTQAVPALVDMICRVDNPVHKQLAAVCIEKIVKARDGQATDLLLAQRARLRRELRRLQTAAGDARADRAAKAVGRLLKRCGA